jgi:phage/plasmid-like protein (TIGR03299 family)
MTAYFDRGFSVRETPWHKLGEVVQDYPGREQAMRLAGHDFRVIEHQLLKAAPLDVQGNPTGIPQFSQPIEGWKGLVNENNGRVLNVVRNSYAVVQNDTLWDIVDAIVGQPNVRYETAGILKDGAILWVLAWLDEPQTVTGDDSPIYPFCLVSTTHDGSGATQAAAVSIRVVCWNTFSAASEEAHKSGREFTFRHTKNVMSRIEDAKLALQGIRLDNLEFLALSEELAQLKAPAAARETFITEFIPTPPEALISDRVAGNIEDARDAVRQILAGNTIADAHRETGYGLFTAGIEYLDHYRRARNPETKFGRTILRQERAKDKLVSLVRSVTA